MKYYFNINTFLFSLQNHLCVLLNDTLTELMLDSLARANHSEILSPLSFSDTGPIRMV